MKKQITIDYDAGPEEMLDAIDEILDIFGAKSVHKEEDSSIIVEFDVPEKK